MTAFPLLAIDTSTDRASVALWRDPRCSGYVQVLPETHPIHAHRTVLRVVDTVCRAAGVSIPEMAGFAVGVGPGSFTGIRMGMGIVQGLAWALERPICGISSLEAAAHAAATQWGMGCYEIWMDARRASCYRACYTVQTGPQIREQEAPTLVGVDQLASPAPPGVVRIWLGADAPPGLRGIPAAHAFDVGILARDRDGADSAALCAIYVREQVVERPMGWGT